MACHVPLCSRQSRSFVYGIPVAIFLVCLAIGLGIGANAIRASQVATESAFGDASLASGTVLQASLTTTLSHLNTAARALEVSLVAGPAGSQ